MTKKFEVKMDEYLPLRDVVFKTLRQAILAPSGIVYDDCVFAMQRAEYETKYGKYRHFARYNRNRKDTNT